MAKESAFIGEVSKETGISIHAIRFYEAEGLLGKTRRSPSGYRLYSPQTVSQLKFIRKAQELGFRLQEIRELAALKDQRTDACSHVKSLVEEKLVNIRRKRRELESMERDLKRILAECDQPPKDIHPGHGKPCPFLIKLGREGGPA